MFGSTPDTCNVYCNSDLPFSKSTIIAHYEAFTVHNRHYWMNNNPWITRKDDKKLVVIVICCTDSGFNAFIHLGTLEHDSSSGIRCMCIVMHSVIQYYWKGRLVLQKIVSRTRYTSWNVLLTVLILWCILLRVLTS